jgi:hypothetical protein
MRYKDHAESFATQQDGALRSSSLSAVSQNTVGGSEESDSSEETVAQSLLKAQPCRGNQLAPGCK